ncbi:MAG: GGDEF domain-containing protein [Nakamurella sp.]
MSDEPSQTSRWTVAAIVAVAIAALAWSVASDWRLPDSNQWFIVGVLAAVAIFGYALNRIFGPPDSADTPPWDVHTVWLLPAALLCPPVGFGLLLALSLSLSFTRRAHPLPTRIVVASITVLTTVSTLAVARWIDDLLLAGVVSIGALYLIGAIIALAAAQVFFTPSGTALWLDYRWSLIQLGCAFSGLLTAVTMVTSPLAGLAALAPLLLASFALHWPELERRALIDPKTGLPNARHWEDRSRDLISAAAMHENPVAVLMLDIDHFKKVNDSHGHIIGDEVLESLAATLRSQVNPGDMIGRFGGEEFVVTLFNLPHDSAVDAAERIRRAVSIQGHRFGHLTTSRVGIREDMPLILKNDADPTTGTFTITCTIGIATSATHGYRLDDLLGDADRALGAGKAAGRNQVSVAAAYSNGSSEAQPSAWAVASQKRGWIAVAGQLRDTRRSNPGGSDPRRKR